MMYLIILDVVMFCLIIVCLYKIYRCKCEIESLQKRLKELVKPIKEEMHSELIDKTPQYLATNIDQLFDRFNRYVPSPGEIGKLDDNILSKYNGINDNNVRR
jgi:hypothetical protein